MDSTVHAPGLDPIRSVAVIGAGERGRAFALRCVQAGFTVVLEDVLSSNLRKAAATIAETSPASQQRIRYATSVEDAVREADVAVDFVPDELESKLEIFSMLDRMAPPRTIFCTPTSLSVADLASCTYRPALCCGLGSFGDRGERTVALIQGSATSTETVIRVTSLFERLGFRVEVRRDEAEVLLHPTTK